MPLISVKVSKRLGASYDPQPEMEKWLNSNNAVVAYCNYRTFETTADDWDTMCWWDLYIEDPKIATLFKLTFGGK